MNKRLERLLNAVKETGGEGQYFDVEWGDVLPARSKEVVIFFLNSNRLYVASSSKAGLVVGVVINRTNKIGGLVDIYAHYCFPEPDKVDLFDVEEEARYNKTDDIFYSIAFELGYVL